MAQVWLPHLSWLSWLAVVSSGGLLYCVATVVYRLYLSPLSKFPGPKLAAATLLYEAYYDIVHKGQYTFKIRELHEKYGPIIRISPYELHINDTDYYEHLYSLHQPRNKYKYFTDQFGIPKSTFSTIDHRHHRLRRQPQGPFFSKASILRLEPVISQMVEKLCSRLDEFKRSGDPMPIRLGFQCLTTDIITLYAMNKSWNFLDAPDFNPEWFETIKTTGEMGHILKHMPWAFPVFKSLPDWLVAKISPQLGMILAWQYNMAKHIQSIIDEKNCSSEKNQEGVLPRTIFQAVLDSNLPPEEKSLERLWQEAQLIIGAGTDTTAGTLTNITFHILDNPQVYAKLRKELEAAIPEQDKPVDLTEMENLPYLSAVIQEGLRLSYGVATRLARVAPDEDLKYHDYTIPRGTPVGMTAVLLHHNEAIFPDSHSFVPERWLGDETHSLDRYMISFSRGNRNCLGMNLAKAELFLTLATVFRRYDMKLYDTDRARDVDLAYDGFLPQPSPQSRGVRVILS